MSIKKVRNSKTIVSVGISILTLIIITFAVFSCAPAAAPTTTPTTAAPKAPIKIGVELPFTGVFAWMGEACKAGFDVGMMAAGGEIAGHKIEIIVEDDEANPDTAVTKARKLVEKDGVNILFGPMLEFTGEAVQSYLRPNWIPNYSPGGGMISRIVPDAFVIGGHWSEENITVPFATYCVQKLGYKNVIAIGSDYSWGYKCADAFCAGFEKAGGKVVAKIYIPLGTMDMSPYIDQIKKYGNQVDLIYDFIVVDDGVKFHRQFAEQGLKVARFAGESTTSGALRAEVGAAAFGCYNGSTWMYEVSNYVPAAKTFVDLLKKEKNIDGDYFSVCGYEGAKILTYALQSLNGEAGDRQALLDAIVNVQVPEKDNAYTKGVLTFDKQYRYPILDAYMGKVVDEGGKPVEQIIDIIKNCPPKMLD